MPQKLSTPETESLQKKQDSAARTAAPAHPAATWQRLTPASIMQLQRTAGNRAVTRLLQRQASEESERSATGAVSRGGLPDTLRSGIESLSGMDMSDVRVHHNSADAGRAQALAYAQGNDIHLGPGQERHLPHEAWHVVQQRQGRVQPTGTVPDGRPLNDSPALESEADTMGARALQTGSVQLKANEALMQQKADTVQRMEDEELMQQKAAPMQRMEDESEDEGEE